MIRYEEIIHTSPSDLPGLQVSGKLALDSTTRPNPGTVHTILLWSGLAGLEWRRGTCGTCSTEVPLLRASSVGGENHDRESRNSILGSSTS